MASFFRWRIADKVIPLLNQSVTNEYPAVSNVVSSIVKVNKFKSKEPQLFLPWKTLTHVLSPVDDLRSPVELVKLLRNQGLPTKEGIIDITLCKQPLSIVFTVDKHVFSKIVLMDICANEEIIAKSSCLFQGVSPKKILVECWTPKIGEKFKMSHFRSLIHSNFVANINRAVGHDVKKITHVADWGLESASLLRGFQQFGRKELLSDNAVEHLCKVSKATNLHYENDLTFQNNVKLCFEKMKEGNDETLSEWNNVKDHFLKHYDSIYERIGVTFDDRLFDSSYSEEIEETCNRLLEKNLLVIQEDGKVKINVAFNGTENIFINREINSIVYKLSRAVCGASHRKKKYNFDAIYYVAPTTEANFFSTVFSLIKELEHNWHNSLYHLKLKSITSFDKKLKNVDAENIIGQAKTYTKDMLKRDLYLQDDEISEEMAEILSLSSLLINDMTHKRSFDYKFDWKQILNLGERSGAGLQFCHAGLKGLQKDSDFYYKVEIDTSPLLEKEAHHLIKHLSRFDEVVYQSYQTLEPHIILEYLFSLSFIVDKAANVLKIDLKEDRLIVLKARLMLFDAALKTFQKGFNLLGITPLEINYTPPDLLKK